LSPEKIITLAFNVALSALFTKYVPERAAATTAMIHAEAIIFLFKVVHHSINMTTIIHI